MPFVGPTTKRIGAASKCLIDETTLVLTTSKRREKVIKNCPIFTLNIKKSNIKDDTKEKIIQNCVMKSKKHRFSLMV